MISDNFVYLDYNATAPARPEVIEAVANTMELGPTNPSSVHAQGREARRRVLRGRDVRARGEARGRRHGRGLARPGPT